MQKIILNADMNTMHDRPLAMREQQSRIPSDRWTRQQRAFHPFPASPYLQLPIRQVKFAFSPRTCSERQTKLQSNSQEGRLPYSD